ncbi:Mitochondrial inner membrane protein oxa1 [Trapelia coarctata]|nr:Mitochondrial inner membrane protein oxa1 [Trapelia coarctata]
MRFASSTTAPPTTTSGEALLSGPEASSTPDLPTDDWAAALDGLNSTELLAIPEQIGYLKALGLDYGWGPTAFIEFLFEHVHVYSGTPWWASIMLTAVVVRVALLKLYIDASDQGARLARASPMMKPIQKKITAATAAGNTEARVVHTQQLRGVMATEGVSYLKLLAPFSQVVLGYGTFRLMKGMASLPVPGLDEGGFLWLKDLTVTDPLYILPVVTSAMMFFTFKVSGLPLTLIHMYFYVLIYGRNCVLLFQHAFRLMNSANFSQRGGEMGTTNSATMTPGMRNAMQYGLPGLSFLFMMWWPACMQLTFATTSLLSYFTSSLLRNPAVRSFLRIKPLPTAPASGAAEGPYKGVMNVYQPPKPPGEIEKPKGVIGGAVADIKGAAKQVMGTAKEMQTKKETGGRLTAGEIRRAKAYEDRRKREIEQEKWEADSRRKRQRR